MTTIAAPDAKSIGLFGIRKSYGSTLVLDGFDLTIPAGSFCTLLGASGSGKTTLLKLIAGFEKPDAGRILIADRDVGAVPTAKRNIGMVFQNYALFPHMRVRANVAFGLEMRGISHADTKARVAEALTLVGLADYGERFPRELSGGQQQRVALARALVIRPDILLMDEPLGALDKNLRQTLQSELKLLQTRIGVTVVFVTHDQEEALHLSDMIVLLKDGAIEQVGTPADLYLRPRNRFTAAFLGDCNFRQDRGAVYGLRPERIRLGPAAAVCEHRVEGRIQEVVFLGNGLRVYLRTGEDIITALVPTTATPFAFSAGQIVTAGFDRSDMMLLNSAAQNR